VGRFAFVALAGVVSCLWLSATAGDADACIAGSPCLKYRRTTQTVNVHPEYFARADRSTIPKFDRKKLAHFLATARWSPVYAENDGIGNPYYRVNYVKNPTKLRFVDATARFIPTPGKDEQVVIVRGIERNSEGDVFVDVDGVAYELWYCVSKKAAAPCLTNTATDFYSMFPLTADAPQPSPPTPRVFADDDLEVPILKKPPF
jgi:hypothetical protein